MEWQRICKKMVQQSNIRRFKYCSCVECRKLRTHWNTVIRSPSRKQEVIAASSPGPHPGRELDGATLFDIHGRWCVPWMNGWIQHDLHIKPAEYWCLPRKVKVKASLHGVDASGTAVFVTQSLTSLATSGYSETMEATYNPPRAPTIVGLAAWVKHQATHMNHLQYIDLSTWPLEARNSLTSVFGKLVSVFFTKE